MALSRRRYHYVSGRIGRPVVPGGVPRLRKQLSATREPCTPLCSMLRRTVSRISCLLASPDSPRARPRPCFNIECDHFDRYIRPAAGLIACLRDNNCGPWKAERSKSFWLEQCLEPVRKDLKPAEIDADGADRAASSASAPPDDRASPRQARLPRDGPSRHRPGSGSARGRQGSRRYRPRRCSR